MKRLLAVAILAALALVPGGTRGDFLENFDSYANGTSMHGVGGWEGWDGNPAGTAYVSNAQSVSSPNSVDISGSADLVHPFSDITDGLWYVSAKQYVPSGTTGSNYFILLNSYPYINVPDSWSVSLLCDLDAGTVTDFWKTSNTVALAKDRWVDIDVSIDLDGNHVNAYYDNQLVLSGPWYGDTKALQAIDLYSENTGPVYYDDIRAYIPEPCSLILLALGALGLFVWRRRRG